MQEGADLNIAFDPKWSQVLSFSYLEGRAGQTELPCEKTTLVGACTGCAISRDSLLFPAGAVHLPDALANRYAWVASNSNFVFRDQLFELEFAPTSWGASGNLGFLFYILYGVQCYIDYATHQLHFLIARTAPITDSVGISYTIPDIGAFVGVKHALRCGMTATDLFIELDGVEVARGPHGATAVFSTSATIRLGGSGSAGSQLIGYIGQWRWSADLRPEDMGRPMSRFPLLAAVDPHREKVVFHSRFNGPAGVQEAVDTKGKTIVFAGAAALSYSNALAGACLRLNGSPVEVVHGDFNFGTDDFSIEWFNCRPGNDGLRRFVLCLMDIDGDDHALSLSGGSGAVATLRVAGVDIEGPPLSFPSSLNPEHLMIVRSGGYIAYFKDGYRYILYDIGDTPVASNGRLVFGHAGTVPGYPSNFDFIDEMRITRGESRVSPLAVSFTPPAEYFNVYGPRAISGHVDDADGNPVDCVVRVHRSLTGQMVSEGRTAADGSFVLPVADIDEHYWTAHLPGKNALIYDHVVPELVT